MKVLIFVCAFLTLAWASPATLNTDEDLPSGDVVPRIATEDDMTFHFFTRKNSNGPAVNIRNLSTSNEIKKTFNTKLDTLVVIHGWQDDYDSNYNQVLRTSALENSNINVIIVDWHPHAGQNYLHARRAVASVGKYVGHFIEDLSNLYKYSLSKITIVGFSLGAHVAGTAGARVNGEIGKIVGLDPAGPLFSTRDAEALDKSDAKYVQVIHTNAGVLGITASIGHSDYWPNNGSNQRGCGLDLLGGCAHNRVYELYAESLGNNNFVAQKCRNYRQYSRGRCTGPTALMGGFNLDTTASGNYFLDTNGATPYARGPK